MRFSWIRAGGMAALSAAVMALQGAPAAIAQFVPYGGSPNQGYNQYQAHTAQQSHTAQQAPPHYTAMAFQGSDTRSAMPSVNQSVEVVQPGQVFNSGQAMQAAPVQSYSAAPAAGCNCQSAPAPTGFENYPSHGSTAGGWGSGSSCGG